MNLESQVVSLELAKRLKEFGVKQESLFCWSETETVPQGRDFRLYYKGENAGSNLLDYSAFTVSELGELLPYSSPSSRDDTGWYMNVINPLEKWKKMYPCNTEANARAKMLIHLLENGLIKNDK